MDQTSAKQRIVVDEHDMEAWPAITRENNRPAPTENELKAVTSSAGTGHTISMPTNMPAAAGQSNEPGLVANTVAGGAKSSSIWNTSWGSITTTAAVAATGSTSSSVWGNSTPAAPAGDAEGSKEARPGWNGGGSAGNGNGKSGEESNGMDTQPAVLQGQGERMQTESPQPTSAVPTSTSGWGQGKDQTGANNSATSANGSSWTTGSNAASSSSQLDPTSTAPWSSSNSTTTLGSSGWGSAPPKTPTSSWGDMPSTTSSTAPSTGWGAAPASSNSGWGGKPNSSQQTNSSEAAAVPGWGDSATPGSQWGRPGQTPPSVGPTGWGTLPSPSPTVGPTGAGWGGHSAAVTNDGVDSRSNRQPPTPTGWGGGDTRRNGSNSSGWGAPAGSSWESGSRSEAKFSSLDSEGWGKKPINQDTQWEGVGQQVPKTVDNGTAAWGSSQSTPAAPGWGANPPPPSAWGKPRMPTEASQVVTQSVPPPAQSAWGGDRKPAWGVPPGRNDGNVGIPGAGMRGGSGMEGNMAVRGMVGNSAVGGSGGIGMSGSSAMGSGSSSQWRQPAGPMERRESTGQSRPTGWGNPLGGMPPGGNTHSQSDNSSWGTWSNEEANPPQEAPPPPRMPEKLSGWSDISDIPTTIIPTGWGGPTQQPPNKMPVDDGTFVWGNSTEHNARIAAQNRRNIARIASMLTVDAHSTMQTPPPGTPGEAADGTAVPPSPVTTSAPEGSANPAAKPEGGATTPSAWGEAGQEQKVQGWGETPKASEEAPATGWTRNGAAKPAASSGKWDEPWGGSSTTGGSTQEKDSMQTGWNEGPNGSGNAVGHWGGEEDWDTKSQSSESSVSSSNWMKGRKPVRGTNGTGSIGQKESNHWISKLKRLMDQGYRQEEAEMALKKHNMNFDSALMELRQMSDGKSNDFDAHLRQVNRDMGSLMLGGDNHLSDGPKPFGMGDASLPPPSPMSNAGMMNNPMGPKPGFGNMGRSGFPPNQQRFSGMQQQQQQGFAPPFAPPSQPMRAPFNQQMMQQQQQQQQQQQFQNFLQMAVQAGLINQSLLQQPLSHQQVLQVFQNIQQQTQQLFQAQQQNVPGKMLNMRQQQELMQRLIAMQQQQMNQPTQRGMPRPPFNQRGKLHSDSEVFPNNDGGSANHADFSVKEPQQSRLSQFFAQRQSLSSTVGKPTSDLFPSAGRNDSIASISDVSSRSDGWSRSNSPTQSDSLPQSADSTFSDSGWSFPHSNSEIDLLEFKPGVPWKPRTKDVANDPHATPGSVNNDLLNSSSLTVGGTTRSSTNRNDRGSRDDISGILIKPMKPPPPNSNWSGGNPGNSKKSSWNYQDQGSAFSQPTSASNWNVPSTNQRPPRPPPGLADQPRNAGWPVSSSQNVPGGRAWDRSHSTSGAWPGSECATNWLVLRNLTPQIDGSTLRLLCLQHGPLEHFHMNLSQGTAIIAYKTRDEAFKAQRSLNTCVLSNTTIIADFATSADIARSRDRSQSQSGGSKFSAGSGNPGGSLSGISSFGIKEESRTGGSGGQWNGVGTPSLWSTNTSTTSTPWSGGETETPATGVASSLSFLPGDLLGEGTM